MTLGISTNTRLLGMAIIAPEGLAVYKVFLHKSSWSPVKANLIISSLEPCVRQYSIKRVVLSIPPLHHQTEAFLALIDCLRKYFEGKGIVVVEVSVASVYALCPPGGRRTKKEVMEALTSRYPELYRFYKKEITNKRRYYIKLFEAVGVAVVSNV